MATSPAQALPPTTKRAERMLLLLRSVNARGTAAVSDLAAELRVSSATMRRDLAEMEDRGLLTRTHGGVRANPQHDELPVGLRDLEAREAKHRIAARTAALVAPGPRVVALTGGTTTAEVARALSRRRQLTIVTNAVTIALELAARPSASVVLAGGRVRSASLEAVGVLAEHAFAVLRADTVVLGVDGISAAGGATTHDEVEARTSRVMVAHAARVLVAADGSKVGRVTAARMTAANRIEALITDTTADPDELQRLRDEGVVVHLVEPRR